jgi:hypothetical protein
VLDDVTILPTDRDREQSGRDWDSTGDDSAIARHLAEVIVCNEGYSSSLAAATLVTLGVAGATDLIGGYRALRAVGSASALPPTPTPSDPHRSPTSASSKS